MSHNILPYLQCLRKAFVTLSSALEKDPALAPPCAISGRLLDRMIVEQTTALQLRAESYASVLKVLPAAEALIGTPSPAGNPVLDSIRELAAICRTSDTAAFNRFKLLCGDVQRALLALGTAPALVLVKAILQTETDYSFRFDAAVSALAAEYATPPKMTSGARNVKEIDQDALLDFIHRTFPVESKARIAKSSFVSGGYSKFTVALSLADTVSLPREVILRGDGPAMFGGASVIDEHRLIKAMHENGVSVPRPLALETSGKVFGSPFLLVERKSGKPMGNMFNLPAAHDEALNADIAAKLAAIHLVPLDRLPCGIDGADTPASAKVLAWIEEGHKNWLPLNMPSPVFEAAFDWLRRHAGINDEVPRTLVHGDYALHNLLFENNKVSTILDWEFAHIGNPTYDLGYFYFMAESLGDWNNFLQAYGKAGMPIPSQKQIDYHILLAATRLGVMVCQSDTAFTSGAETGLVLAPNMASCYYEMTIARMSSILNKVY